MEIIKKMLHELLLLNRILKLTEEVSRQIIINSTFLPLMSWPNFLFKGKTMLCQFWCTLASFLVKFQLSSFNLFYHILSIKDCSFFMMNEQALEDTIMEVREDIMLSPFGHSESPLRNGHFLKTYCKIHS